MVDPEHLRQEPLKFPLRCLLRLPARGRRCNQGKGDSRLEAPEGSRSVSDAFPRDFSSYSRVQP